MKTCSPLSSSDVHEVQSRRHGTRIFRHIGTRPYQRLDGTMTTLSVWRCACVHCGTPFQITTPARARKSGAFGVVHCLEHRKSATRSGIPFFHTGIDQAEGLGELGWFQRTQLGVPVNCTINCPPEADPELLT